VSKLGVFGGHFGRSEDCLCFY